MLTRPMYPGDSMPNQTLRHGLTLLLIPAVVSFAALASAQPGDVPPDLAPGAAASDPSGGAGAAGGAAAEQPGENDDDKLVCDGDWRYELTETRQEIGPARFARKTALQRELALVGKAFAYCETQARKEFGGTHARSAGPCYGLLPLSETVVVFASNLFKPDDTSTCECLTQQARANSSCEGQREHLTALRRFGEMMVARAELVLSHEVCASPERDTNSTLRSACSAMDAAVDAEYSGTRGKPGQFNLSAPLPEPVAKSVDKVRSATDGRYQSVVLENAAGMRGSLCRIQPARVTGDTCELAVLDMGTGGAQSNQPGGPLTDLLRKQRRGVMWGLCNELALANVNAETCRKADIYIDERGELHLNSPLNTAEQRKSATLCIDISDFDQDHPLMVTLGTEPTSSVPERIWPGETMHIGSLLSARVTPEDVLRIHVLGKARGVSLSELLRVNGVPGYTGDTLALRSSKASKQEACRLARSWVPVVDHEVPIGMPSRQAVIPLQFGRGRDGETEPIQKGDYVVLWVRDIEPSGSIQVEYANGQTVGYRPPPLLGEPPDLAAQTRGPDGLMDPNSEIRGATAGVSQPLLPRRARYPGSRVLRLGAPAGNRRYSLKVCTRTGQTGGQNDGQNDGQTAGAPSQASSCSAPGASVILDEKLFVSEDYHFGLRMHFGYTYFPVARLAGRRTPAAQAAGDNVFEVVETGAGTADYDVAVLLAVYPFGRDPSSFSYRPWKRDYWKHSALLTGFSIRSLSPWDDFYMGGSLPLANGISLSVLSHFSRRDLPIDAEVGDLFPGSGDGSINLNNFYDTKSSLVVGVSLGLSIDYDLFERAFFNIWNRVRGGNGQFLSGAPRPRPSYDY